MWIGANVKYSLSLSRGGLLSRRDQKLRREQAQRTQGISRILLLFGCLAILLGAAIPPIFALPHADRGPTRTLDDRFADIAARVPAFGGMFLEGGALKVYMTNRAQAAAAETAIGQVFGRDLLGREVQVIQGQYGFLQLKAWHDRMNVLFNLPGVILTDIDEATNRLDVGVENSGLFGAVEQELARIGVPRAAVNIATTEPVVRAVSLTDRIRPIVAGIQIAFTVESQGFFFVCTLTFNGVRAGVAGFVVASHCTSDQGGVEGTQHFQPRPGAADLIGTEIADPVYTTSNCPPEIHGQVCRFSDSAFSQLAAGVTQDIGFIARPDSVNTGSLTIAGTFRITDEGASLVGDTVNKVGRTTGWTQGLVTDTCVNTGVLGTRIVQLCQDFVNAGVAGGDSGSPVFEITNPVRNDVELRGILWGGSGSTTYVYSPIANIQQANELGPIANCAGHFKC